MDRPMDKMPVVVLAGAIAMAVALAGCCGGGPKHSCTAALEYAGGKYSSKGTGDTKEEAEKSAVEGTCIFYCERGDATVEAAWQKYKSTPEGKSKSTKEYDVIGVPSVKAAYESCKARCASDIAAKKANVVTTCEK